MRNKGSKPARYAPAVAFDVVDRDLDLVALEERVLRAVGATTTSSPRASAAARAHRSGCSTRARPPPTAGPGIHHVWARSFKDLYPRFHTMRGQLRRPQGRLGLPRPARSSSRSRRSSASRASSEIEEYGIEAFNRGAASRCSATSRTGRRSRRRIGMWLDTDDAYWTLTNEYIESVWWLFTQMWDNGADLRGLQGRPLLRALRHRALEPRARPARRVPRTSPSRRSTCASPSSTATSTSSCGRPRRGRSSSNVAAAVGPDVEYVRVRGRDGGRDLVIGRGAGRRRCSATTPRSSDRSPVGELVGLALRAPVRLPAARRPTATRGGSSPTTS